jgi:hypothetical protein
VKDYQIISGCFSLGIIGDEAHFSLELCREFRNNFSVAHYPPTDKGYTIKKVSEDMIRKDIEDFDDAFPDGLFAIPRNPKEPRVKVRALHDYCKAKGITPSELTKDEMEQFLER